jgi:hypothetical protein
LLEGNFGEFGHGAHAQPRHDARTMKLNGLNRDVKSIGDFFIGPTFYNKLQNLPLAVGSRAIP